MNNIQKIDVWQKRRQEVFKSVPAKGRMVNYLGKRFLVYKNTFWPFKDSQPLVESLKINSGESILDVGTGSGVIAIFACYKGAGRVVATDINPQALKSARYNAKAHGFSKVLTIKKSDVFDNLEKERFDVITANLPFRNKSGNNIVAKSQWDTNFNTNKRFFKNVGKYLKLNGKIYFAQSSFGSIPEVRVLARQAGFSMKMLRRSAGDKSELKTFYAFILKRDKKHDAKI